jgi:hypothetical protein
MERAAPHAGRLRAEQPADALSHLAGGLVGERDRENVFRIDAVVLDQMRDARREHAGLARARTRQHEHRAFEMQHRFALGRIEAAKPVLRHRR